MHSCGRGNQVNGSVKMVASMNARLCNQAAPGCVMKGRRE